MDFDDFLTDRMDELDNAVYALLHQFLLLDAENTFPWDMEIIGTVSDQIEDILTEHGFFPCRPYYEGDNRVPCYAGHDCKHPCCPLKASGQGTYTAGSASE